MKRTADPSREPVVDEEEPKQVRRIFQSLEYQVDPVTGKLKFLGISQYVTYMSRGRTDPDLGVVEPAQTHVIDRNSAGQFVLNERADHYYQQLTALRKICRDHPDRLTEVAMDKENIPPVIKEPKSESVSDRKLREFEEERINYLKELGQLGDASKSKDKKIYELEAELRKLKTKGESQ